MALAARVAAEDAPPLRSLRPECPAALAEVVDACLRRDVAARLASGEAVREASGPVTTSPRGRGRK